MKLSRILGPKSFDMVSRLVIPRVVSRNVRRFRRRGAHTPEGSTGFLLSKKAEFIKPWQHREEIGRLAEIVYSSKPATILEIGTAAGGTLFLFASLAPQDALIVSVDLPFGMYGGGYPVWKIPLYKSFAREMQTIELIRGDSHSLETFEQLKGVLRGRSIDFMFIDGDHTYEGVKKDFESYSRLMSENGIVAFHDIVPDRSESPDHFVSDFWKEIKNYYRHEEIIRDKDQSKLGIGVLFFGEPFRV
jgi:predicted O-methyltransferase YrrM